MGFLEKRTSRIDTVQVRVRVGDTHCNQTANESQTEGLVGLRVLVAVERDFKADGG